ncbi:MAG: hypothetical protein BGN88_04735 [Clostridiales bacterium 43-6]|nr:MAG: hypothetical protein BGN88_04735 [Clostridiales bacterium 43-6]
MKNAVITGATGFIGGELTKLLLQNNVEVYAVVRPDSPHIHRLPKSDNLHIIALDMKDIAMLAQLKLPQIDTFYHLAWDGIRAKARDDVLLQENNYKIAMEAVQTAHALKCNLFVGAGSQAEYGITEGKLDEQERSENPVTAYGKAKLKLFYDANQLAKELKMHFVWARIFSLFGPNDNETTLIMSCIKKMLRNEAVDLTPCGQMWDFLHVSDAANALYLLGSSPKANGMYHIASGEPRILKEYILELAEQLHAKVPLHFGAFPYPAEGAVGFQPSVDRLKVEFNWKPQFSFQEGISDILRGMNETDEV